MANQNSSLDKSNKCQVKSQRKQLPFSAASRLQQQQFDTQTEQLKQEIVRIYITKQDFEKPSRGVGMAGRRVNMTARRSCHVVSWNVTC